MDTTTFNTHNITAMREKGDGITVIFHYSVYIYNLSCKLVRRNGTAQLTKCLL